jgi:iron(III) transport system ATP-binding protein
LYEHPPTPAAAAAIGTSNLLPGRIGPDGLHCALGRFPACAAPAADCLVMLRPEHLKLSRSDTVGPRATVVAIAYHGHDTLIDLRLHDPTGLGLRARKAAVDVPPLGSTVAVTVDATIAPHVWAAQP